MQTLCCRCSYPATIAMSYDYGAQEMWLHDLDASPIPGHDYPLCDEHGERLTPPVGWTLTNRCSPVRPLFLEVDVA